LIGSRPCKACRGDNSKRPAALRATGLMTVIASRRRGPRGGAALNGEISDLGPFAELRKEPIRLAPAACPGLCLVIRINKLGGAGLAAAATPEKLVDRKAALFSELRQCLLHLGPLTVAGCANRLLNLALELEQIFQRHLIDIGGGHTASPSSNPRLLRQFANCHILNRLNYFLPCICQAGSKKHCD